MVWFRAREEKNWDGRCYSRSWQRSPRLVVGRRHPFSKLEWQKLRERNEALDCRVYARAAAWIAGIDRFREKHWKRLEEELGVGGDFGRGAPDEASQTGTGNRGKPSRRRRRRVVRSKWMMR